MARRRTDNAPKDTPTINRNEFIEAINRVRPGISSGALVEQADLLMMDGERLYGFNDEISVSYPFKTGQQCGVFVEELFKLLQKIGEDEIELSNATKDKKNQLIITAGNTTAGFYTVPDVPIPDIGLDEVIHWIELPKDFCEAIEFCLPSAATDPKKGILNCLKVEKQAVISCNNYQATVRDLSTEIAIDLIVPRTAAKDLSEYNPVEVAANDSWIHFKNDEGVTFSCRTMTGEWPNVMGLFEIDEYKKIILPKNLKAVLKKAEIMTDKDNKTVVLEFGKDHLVCKAETEKVGWIEERLDIDNSEEIPDVMINPDLLAAILNEIQEVKITDRAMVFEGQTFSHVIGLKK